MKLHIRTVEDFDEKDFTELSEKLRKFGVTGLRPLVPGVPDADLKSLYVADCDDAVGPVEALRQLHQSASVRFAEAEVRRRLFRSKAPRGKYGQGTQRVTRRGKPDGGKLPSPKPGKPTILVKS